MKSDRISGTSNQITATDEIMPDLNHSGIYNTQNSQQTLCVRVYIGIMWRQNVRKQIKSTKRGINANIDLKKKILKQIDVYGSLLEGKRHQSLAKPDKLNFEINQSKLN